MIRRKSYLIVALTLATALVSSLFISSSFALSKPASCSGDSCSVVGGGGGGTHLSGNQGGGNLAGYNAVRLDAFRPDPNPQVCTTPSRSRFRSLGITDDGGPYYTHYRVAMSRTTGEILGGVPDAKYWNTGWDADTGDAVGGVPVGKGPTHADSTIGANWRAQRTYCLPLLAGSNFEAMARAEVPTAILKPQSKAVVGMKGASISVNTDAFVNGSGTGVNVDLELSHFHFEVKRISKDAEGNEVKRTVAYNQSNSPIKITRKSGEDFSDGGAVYTVKFKKKGIYEISIQSVYKGYQDGNIYLGNAMSDWEINQINVIDVKTINRKTSS